MSITETAGARPTLVATLWPAQAGGRLARLAVLALLGTALLTLSAKIHVPFYPVPLTLQTLAVLAIGMAYGWRLGGATVLLYLAEGAVGLPVFSGTPERGIGLAYMMGPTGGYLVGFVVAAALAGWLAERGWDRSAFLTALAMIVGNIVIYALGVAWLSGLVGSVDKAFTLGVAPFFYGDALKIAIAVIGLPMIWRLLGRARA